MTFALESNTSYASDGDSPYETFDLPYEDYTSGRLAIVFVEHCSNNGLVTSLTDTGGNSFERLGYRDGATGNTVELWWDVLTASFSANIQVNFPSGGSTYPRIGSAQYSFAGTLKAPTLTSGANDNSGTFSSGSVQTTQSKALCVAFWGFDTGQTGSSYTNGWSTMYGSSDYWIAHKLNVAAGTQSTSWTGASTTWCGVIGAFEELDPQKLIPRTFERGMNSRLWLPV